MMPPKKKPTNAELPPNKVGGMFGWCLIPKHDLCQGEGSVSYCTCACHTEKKVEKSEPTTPRADS